MQRYDPVPSVQVLQYLRRCLTLLPCSSSVYGGPARVCLGSDHCHAARRSISSTPWARKTTRTRTISSSESRLCRSQVNSRFFSRGQNQTARFSSSSPSPSANSTSRSSFYHSEKLSCRRFFNSAAADNQTKSSEHKSQAKQSAKDNARRAGRRSPSLSGLLDDVGTPVFGRRKPGNELKLRCTEIDENGNVITVNGEFRKSELIAKYGLLPRDLRKIDSSLLPHILVRPSAILINLLHLRVLIKHNCVLVLDTYGSTDSFSQSQFMYDLCGKLSQKENKQLGSLPYEFRALEAILISVTGGLEGEFEGVSEPVVRVLRELEEDIDRDKLRHLLIYSKRLSTFEQKARLVRDAIDDLLEADDDLVTMYLTERAQGKIREEDDHTEVEMLLESYHKVCDEIVQISGNLVSNIRNTEEIVKAILDANRNSLIMLDLKFSIGTLGLGSGAFIASLYGMNLKNFIEESDIGFFGVSVFSFAFALVICGFGLKKLRKVQRVSLWGERGRGERGSWREIGHTGPLDRVSAWETEARRERLQRLQRHSREQQQQQQPKKSVPEQE